MATVKIDYVEDWETRLLGRLYWQFRGKPKLAAWVRLIARQTQDVEDVLQGILTIISIDDSVGAQLDNLGRILGQMRAGASDADYITYLKARIVANKSDGTPEAVYKVFRALYGTAVVMALTTSGIGVKAFRLTVRGVLTATQVLAGLAFLGIAKEAGARAILEWQPAVDTAVMRWDVAGQGWDTFPMGGADQA